MYAHIHTWKLVSHNTSFTHMRWKCCTLRYKNVKMIAALCTLRHFVNARSECMQVRTKLYNKKRELSGKDTTNDKVNLSFVLTIKQKETHTPMFDHIKAHTHTSSHHRDPHSNLPTCKETHTPPQTHYKFTHDNYLNTLFHTHKKNLLKLPLIDKYICKYRSTFTQIEHTHTYIFCFSLLDHCVCAHVCVWQQINLVGSLRWH